MTLQTRIEKLEARQRERAEAEAPPQRQHCDRAPDGAVIACETLTWPTIRQQREQGMTWGDAMRLVQREPFSRSTCVYSECEHRARCGADGSPTSWVTPS